MTFKEIPFEHFNNSLGKRIEKIGIDPHKNTCRIVLEDNSILWVQSVGDDDLLLKHGLSCDFIPDGERAQSLANSEHVEWHTRIPLDSTKLSNSESQTSELRKPATSRNLLKRLVSIFPFIWEYVFKNDDKHWWVRHTKGEYPKWGN